MSSDIEGLKFKLSPKGIASTHTIEEDETSIESKSQAQFEESQKCERRVIRPTIKNAYESNYSTA